MLKILFYFRENDPLSFTIQYGVVDIYSDINVIKALRIIPHRDYSPFGGYKNDIALIEVFWQV